LAICESHPVTKFLKAVWTSSVSVDQFSLPKDDLVESNWVVSARSEHYFRRQRYARELTRRINVELSQREVAFCHSHFLRICVVGVIPFLESVDTCSGT